MVEINVPGKNEQIKPRVHDKKIHSSSRTIQDFKFIPAVHLKQAGTYTEQQQYGKMLEEEDSYKGII